MGTCSALCCYVRFRNGIPMRKVVFIINRSHPTNSVFPGPTYRRMVLPLLPLGFLA